MIRIPLVVIAAAGLVFAGAPKKELPVVFTEDFEKGAERWDVTDKAAWKIIDAGTPRGKVFNQFVKQSNYKPPFRSPFNMALVKDLTVGDFTLDAKCQSTIKDYGHRDMCLFFGHQGPSQFYYVHLGKKADDHANQIFIVNNAARTKISTKTTPGTDWTDNWHNVRVVRDVEDGTIEVYFDDMKTPAMTAKDRTFTWGRVGVGSFDDTGHWDDVTVRGVKVDPPSK